MITHRRHRALLAEHARAWADAISAARTAAVIRERERAAARISNRADGYALDAAHLDAKQGRGSGLGTTPVKADPLTAADYRAIADTLRDVARDIESTA